MYKCVKETETAKEKELLANFAREKNVKQLPFVCYLITSIYFTRRSAVNENIAAQYVCLVQYTHTMAIILLEREKKKSVATFFQQEVEKILFISENNKTAVQNPGKWLSQLDLFHFYLKKTIWKTKKTRFCLYGGMVCFIPAVSYICLSSMD